MTSSSTVVAALEAARDKKAPIILQASQGGAAYFAGKGVDNKDQSASIAGAVAAAHYVRSIAPAYGIPVVLHTDHCAKKLLPWLDGMLDADEKYFKEHGEPLFSSHMIDLSEEAVDWNIETTAKYLKRAAPMKQWLEMVPYLPHLVPMFSLLIKVLRKSALLVAKRTASITRMLTTIRFTPSPKTSIRSGQPSQRSHPTSVSLLASATSMASTSLETSNSTPSFSKSIKLTSRKKTVPRKISQYSLSFMAGLARPRRSTLTLLDTALSKSTWTRICNTLT